MKVFNGYGGNKFLKLWRIVSLGLLACLISAVTLAKEEDEGPILGTTVESYLPDEFSDYEVRTSAASPFSCWACNSTDEGDGCFNLTEEYQGEDDIQQCMPDEHYCKVERVWYVFGANKSSHNFSIYRNCSSKCDPYCLIMGDRTKLYSCATCCQESLCNVGSTGNPSSLPTAKLGHSLLILLGFIQWFNLTKFNT